jgi:hypothetical protein
LMNQAGQTDCADDNDAGKRTVLFQDETRSVVWTKLC